MRSIFNFIDGSNIEDLKRVIQSLHPITKHQNYQRLSAQVPPTHRSSSNLGLSFAISDDPIVKCLQPRGGE